MRYKVKSKTAPGIQSSQPPLSEKSKHSGSFSETDWDAMQPAICEFLAQPDVNTGEELISQFQKVQSSFWTMVLMDRNLGFEQKVEEKFKAIESIYHTLLNLENQLAKVEQLQTNGKIGQAWDLIHNEQLAYQIENINIKNYREKRAKLGRQLEIEVKERQNQLNAMIIQAQAAKDATNFAEARQILEDARSFFTGWAAGSTLSKKEVRPHFESYLRELNVLEEKLNVYRTLVQFATKFPRIHISELSSEMNLPVAKIEPVIKELITEGTLRASYDDSSKGIEFQFLEEEIDELLAKFAEWETGNEGKKA